LQQDWHCQDQVVAYSSPVVVFNLFEFHYQIAVFIILFRMTLPFERQNSAFTEAWHNLDLLAFITQLGSLGVVLNLSALVLELFD
jgi:hypothetical protein